LNIILSLHSTREHRPQTHTHIGHTRGDQIETIIDYAQSVKRARNNASHA